MRRNVGAVVKDVLRDGRDTGIPRLGVAAQLVQIALHTEESTRGEVRGEVRLVLGAVDALVEGRGGAREAGRGGVEVDGDVGDPLDYGGTCMGEVQCEVSVLCGLSVNAVKRHYREHGPFPIFSSVHVNH